MEGSLDLSELKDLFETAEELNREGRAKAERDRRYYDGQQLTDEEIKVLRKRSQPPVVMNRIKPKIDYLIGYEQTNRVDPVALPRTPKHEDDAKAITDVLRYVADAVDLDVIKSDCWKDLLIEGFCGSEVTVREGKRGIEVEVNQILWDRCFYDPHSRRHNFSDARYLGYITWLDRKVAEALYPKKSDVIDASFSNEHNADTYDDKPIGNFNYKDRDRIRVVTMHYRTPEGKWWICSFTGSGKLDDRESPFKDEEGESVPGLIFQSANIDRDNNRYGAVRQMIDAQDEINKRRSKALHLINQRQTMGEKGSVENIDVMKRELAKPDGFIEYREGSKFELLNNTDLATAQISMLQEAKQEIELVGANAALQGKNDQAASGRAIIAQQQGGAIEIKPLLDRLRHWHLMVMRHVWWRVRQFWNEEKWIRVTDDEKNLKWVGLNKPITLGEYFEQQIDSAKTPEAKQSLFDQAQEYLQFNDPNEVVSYKNILSETEVDVIIEEMPDVATLQIEQFELLTNLASSGLLPIPAEVLIAASSLRNKKELLEKLEKAKQAPDPRLELESAKTKAAIEKDITQAKENEASATKTQVETQLLLVA